MSNFDVDAVLDGFVDEALQYLWGQSQ